MSGLRLFHEPSRERHRAQSAANVVRIMRDLCRGMVHIVEDPEQAQISYLHDRPDNVERLIDALPALRKTYRIACFEWGADALPEEFLAGIEMVQEVWTPSFYSWRALNCVHPNVQWIPRSAKAAGTADDADLQQMRTLLGLTPIEPCVLHTTYESTMRQKNTAELVRAFAYVNLHHPAAKLIIKIDDGDTVVRVIRSGQVVYLSGALTHRQDAALLALAQVYVSPHHGEDFGPELFEAMAHGVLTVATGYCGNMDFMTSHNSLLVSFTEANIVEDDLSGLFTSKMRWAYPHRENLEQQILCAIANVKDVSSWRRTARAEHDLRRFDNRHIAVLIRARLRAIAAQIL